MIRSSAPTRIDLAGGTLDLWPLHLFFDNPPTLNAAIDLYASVELTARRDKAIVVESRDLGRKPNSATSPPCPRRHPLVLLIKLIRFYQPKTGLHLVTDCQAPAGSGIGGSSALNIALNGALNRFTKRSYNREQMIEIARNIETQVIDVPAGTQDYYSAMYGGVQSHPAGNGEDRTAASADETLKISTDGSSCATRASRITPASTTGRCTRKSSTATRKR